MEDYRLRVFQNRGLKKIFGPRRDRVRGNCWRVHEEFYYLVISPNINGVVK
jgi:hypothetical protein